MEKNKLSTLPFSLKILATAYLVTFLAGYGVSFVQIHGRTTFEMKKVAEYYRGGETAENEALVLPQSFASITSVAHAHTLSQPMMLSLLGFIFCFSALSEKKKAFFVILAFLGSVLSNAAPWLVRYVSAGWVFLFPISQIFLFVALLVMSARSLYDTWR